MTLSLLDALASAVAARLRQDDLSAWQKASDVAEFQAYLRSAGRPHSTRDISHLLESPQTRVAEQLTIAVELGPATLARYGVKPEELAATEHRALLRIAKLPHYLREKPVREASRLQAIPTSTSAVREKRRNKIYARLREEGQLLIEIPDPIVSLNPTEARSYLDEFLPALAHLAEIVKGDARSHYIGLAGNGGIVIYLSPS